MAQSGGAGALVEQVQRRAADWAPELGSPVEVRLLATRHREFTAVYRLLLQGTARRCPVVVKAYLPVQATADERRPRLGAPDDRRVKHEFEFSALCAAAERIAAAGRPGLRAIRPLGHLADHRAVVMEELPAIELRDLILQAARWGRRSEMAQCRAAVRAAGSWLAVFHGAHLARSVETRRGTARQVVDQLERYVNVLDRWDRTDPARAVAVARGLAADLQDPLELGLGHGDCAPRNVLVDGEGNVAMFDMLGRWRVPVAEDVAYFTTSLRVSPPLVVARASRRVRRLLADCEDEFLAGYRDVRALPPAELELHELLVLLDRRAAVALRGSRVRRQFEAWMVDRSLLQLVRRLEHS